VSKKTTTPDTVQVENRSKALVSLADGPTLPAGEITEVPKARWDALKDHGAVKRWVETDVLKVA
jgi:hypothetical protein